MNYSPEEAARRTRVMDIADAIYGRTSGQVANAAYPGAQPVPRDPLTAQGQQYAVNQAQTVMPQINSQAMGAASFGLGPALYAESNPYLQSYMQAALRPAYQQFTDLGGQLSDIRNTSSAAGQFGGSRQGLAEGVAAGRFGQGMLDTTAGMASRGYDQGLANMSRTMMFLPQLSQMSLQPGQVMESVGLSNESLAQERAQYEAAGREWDLTKEWRALQPYSQMVLGQGATGSTTTANFPGQERNKSLGALGGAASGAAMGSMIAPGWGTAIGALGGLILGLI
jgi:hypothetical protein